MRTEIEYNEPTFSRGYDWNNPLRLRDAFGAMVSSVAELAGEISEHMNNPRYIVVNGEPLDQALSAGAWRRGEIRKFHCTWSEASSICTDVGAVFCDGRNGSPQYHNDPSDSTSVQRYFKAAPFGSNSGNTGGATTHSHTFTQPDAHDEPTVAVDSVDFTNVTAHATCCVGCGTDMAVLVPGANHTGSQALGAAIQGWSGDHTNGAVDDGSHESPYVEVIALMKL